MLRHHVKVLWALIPSVLIAAPATRAALPAQQTFRAGVDAVEFDVTVLDRERRPVTDLTAADFTVLIDNTPARIVAVKRVDLPIASLATGAPWLRDIASDVTTNKSDTRRVVVIVIDDAMTGQNRTIVTGSGLTSGNAGTFRDPWIGTAGKRIAHDVIDELGPKDLAAVVFTYLGRSQNFTRDRAKLLASIDTYVPQSGTTAGPPLGCTYRGYYGCTFDTLEHVIDALPSSPPLRKVIVFISQGLGRIPGFSAEGMLAAEAREANHDVPSAQLADMRRLFLALQRANATVYAYSPGGLQILKEPGADTLRAFTDATGGRAVIDTNAPWLGVPTMMKEAGSYYLVGFDIPQLDARFHRVAISVNRSGAEVRTRAGYVAPNPDGSYGSAPRKNAPAATPLDRAMGEGFLKPDFPLVATAVPRFVPGHKDGDVEIVVGIPTTGLIGPPQRVALRAAAFSGRLFQLKGSSSLTMEFDPAAGPVAETRTRLPLPAGRYELRVAAEGGGRTGSLFFDVEFPEFGKAPLWLSPLGLSLATGPAGTAALTVQRMFSATDHARLIGQIVQGKKPAAGAVSAELTIVDATGRTVVTETAPIPAVAFGPSRSAFVAFDLPVARLTPGEHLASISITRDTDRATSAVRFTRQ